GLHDAGFDQLLVVLPHRGEQFLARHPTGLGAGRGFDEHNDFHRESPMVAHSSSSLPARAGYSTVEREGARSTSRPTKRNRGGARMAEREGFEPPGRVTGQRFSRPPHSTALPPLRGRYCATVAVGFVAPSLRDRV